jgi:tricorn protease
VGRTDRHRFHSSVDGWRQRDLTQLRLFSAEGKWQIENHGVDPDVVVEQDPKAISEGHDPQLEKAVSLAREDLAQHPVPVPERPPYPNYHKK